MSRVTLPWLLVFVAWRKKSLIYSIRAAAFDAMLRLFQADSTETLWCLLCCVVLELCRRANLTDSETATTRPIGKCLLEGLLRKRLQPPLRSNLSEGSSVQGPANETFARESSESPCRAVRLVNFPRDGHEPSACATGSDAFPPKNRGEGAVAGATNGPYGL